MALHWNDFEELEKMTLDELQQRLDAERKEFNDFSNYPAFIHPPTLMEAKKIYMAFLHREIRTKQRLNTWSVTNEAAVG